jgi:hypothetical protein
MTNTTSFSLDKLREDADFAALFAKKAVDIKKNKSDLLQAAKDYQSKYDSEIEAGTRKRNLMLTEGKARGLKEDEIFKDNSLFIPTRETPILNYLFFMLRETKFAPVDIKVLRNYADADKDIQLLAEEYNTKYGASVHEEHVNPMPNMMKFAYGTIDDQTMNTLKKLKTLSQSENEKEAFVAYRKCLELCKKYNMEFSQIPINN